MEKIMAILSVIYVVATYNVQAQEIGQNQRQSIVVTEVIDGDTIDATLLEQKKNVRIRLADIDCPEISKKSGNFNKQIKEWKLSEEELKEKGREAKEKLSALVTLNEDNLYFEYTPQKICGNEKRKVGILWTGDDVNINEYMLKKAGCKPYSCIK